MYIFQVIPSYDQTMKYSLRIISCGNHGLAINLNSAYAEVFIMYVSLLQWGSACQSSNRIVCVWGWNRYCIQRHVEQYLSYIMAVSFIGGVNRSTDL